ncbi:MAG: glycoside hydrolase family 88 protein [Acidobacteriaceae bacterium]|nr:glycoside hydrolase family 88 protein [Acidobacteriaceae bacterium]
MHKAVWALAILSSAAPAAFSQTAVAVDPHAAGAAMAATVQTKWPAAVIPEAHKPGAMTYEVGTLLDGMAAMAEATGDPKDFAYVKAAVDRWVMPDGTVRSGANKPFSASNHALDDFEPGRAIVYVWRRTHDPRYRKAATEMIDGLKPQPRTPEGGYWHKQIYPQQMWLDGAYMAEPFRASYAAEFGPASEFDDIAKQFMLMAEHTYDPKTGLLRHGWDSAHTQPWADKTTGQSQEAWARAMGWYVMALVDSLPYFPAEHPARPAMIARLKQLMDAVVKYQDPQTGLWWDVLDKGSREGNFRETSASAMFVYALAKGVRLGYLPKSDLKPAHYAWNGLVKTFVTKEPDGNVVLHGTVKVSGLGGKPYRAGDYAYYIHEPVGDDDAKGVGAFLLAASEISRAPSQPQKHRPKHSSAGHDAAPTKP